MAADPRARLLLPVFSDFGTSSVELGQPTDGTFKSPARLAMTWIAGTTVCMLSVVTAIHVLGSKNGDASLSMWASTTVYATKSAVGFQPAINSAIPLSSMRDPVTQTVDAVDVRAGAQQVQPRRTALEGPGLVALEAGETLISKTQAVLGAIFFFVTGAVTTWALGINHIPRGHWVCNRSESLDDNKSQAIRINLAGEQGSMPLFEEVDEVPPSIALATATGEITMTPEQIKQDAQQRLRKFEELWQKQKATYASQAEPIEVTLPDGGVINSQSWVETPMTIAAGISKGLAKKAIVAKVDGELWDMGRPFEGSCSLEILTYDDSEAVEVFQHSSAHVLGFAMEDHLGCLLTTGPPLEDGTFFYEADCLEQTVGKQDYSPLENACKKLASANVPYERLTLDKADALEMFAYNPYKASILKNKVPEGGQCTVYRCGDFVDPCRGPHLPSTGAVKALAVTKNSSSYWQGKADQQTLQRVYGVAFPKAKMLKEWKTTMEKAEQNDHRNIGKQQNLWMFHAASPGACFFHPRGARIYNTLVDFIKKQYRVRGFSEVITPNIFNSSLWKQSGHWENYQENMFTINIEDEQHSLKPMNCPSHMLMFGSQRRSYRELPIRYADFGVLHRNELSGTLTGLTRVRRFQQDDAHLFVRTDQISSEIEHCLDFLAYCYDIFGFTYYLNLSTRDPEKFIGDVDVWNNAEARLADAMTAFCGLPKEFEHNGETIAYDGTPAVIKALKKCVADGKYPEPKQYWFLNPGDAAFYGPKIDIQLEDTLKRKHQCGTIQLDFQLPERFKLTYQMSPEEKATREAEGKGGGVDGVEDHARPVVIHRAILGSVERMIAVLTEHWEGKWPFWVSPRQVMVVPVAHEFDEYATEIRDTLHAADFFVDADVGNDQFKKKIRNAQLEQYNIILVCGNKERDSRTANVRTRKGEVVGEMSLDELTKWLTGIRQSYSKEY
jgi:threonyl-tRNA synthetase|uniref:threonine--tRNA ligase n=1 Tax=Eutreptiella gymnastica TaxID=73025 RepID=A0A7S4LLU7_9EUGL